MNSHLEKALKETEKTAAPAVGFSTTVGLGSTQASFVLIKQNNTIIQLLLQQAQETDTIKAELLTLKNRVFGQLEASTSAGAPIPDQIIDELSKKLEGFSIGGGAKRTKVGGGERGVLRAFKDPYVILKEEQEKSKRRGQS